MAKAKKVDAGEVRGLALIDIPQIGARSGEFVTIPADLAAALEASGAFDPKAQES